MNESLWKTNGGEFGLRIKLLPAKLATELSLHDEDQSALQKINPELVHWSVTGNTKNTVWNHPAKQK